LVAILSRVIKYGGENPIPNYDSANANLTSW